MGRWYGGALSYKKKINDEKSGCSDERLENNERVGRSVVQGGAKIKVNELARAAGMSAQSSLTANFASKFAEMSNVRSVKVFFGAHA